MQFSRSGEAHGTGVGAGFRLASRIGCQTRCVADERFAGRRALVVGGAHGIGRATCERLAREGATVVVADLEGDAADELAGRLTGEGHAGVAMDVTDPAAVDAVFARLAEGAPLSVLAHPAGGATRHPPFEETPDEVWSRMLELNLLSVMRVARAAAPLMRRAEGDRAMVFVSSVNALHALGDEPYSVAKAGLIQLAQQLAAEFARDGIRVNAVAPGTVRTRVWDPQPGGADRLRPLYPLGRVGEPEDIAASIAFLASSDASWITGQTLAVDGGLSVSRAALMT